MKEDNEEMGLARLSFAIGTHTPEDRGRSVPKLILEPHITVLEEVAYVT